VKVSKYMKDGKVRLARYVTYNRTAWCAPAAYPAKIAYVQSCADAVVDCTPYLIVTIADAIGLCDLVYYTRFSTEFACNPTGTVVNPDCPPTGWTVVEADTGLDEVCAAVSGDDLIGMACVTGEWGFMYTTSCVVGNSCDGIVWPTVCNGSYINYSYCFKPTIPSSAFNVGFICPPPEGGFGIVRVSASGVYGSWDDAVWTAQGINNTVVLDEYCRPTGSYSIDVYFQGSIYTNASGCLPTPAPTVTPVLIGSVTVTFCSCL